MTRESLYVALTRGREANHAYVATDYIADAGTAHGFDELCPTDLLISVLNNVGAEQSAHQS